MTIQTTVRHPRESGDPASLLALNVKMDPRFRGDDESFLTGNLLIKTTTKSLLFLMPFLRSFALILFILTTGVAEVQAQGTVAAALAAQTTSEKADLLTKLAEAGTIGSAIVSLITFIVTLGGLLGDTTSTGNAAIITAHHLAANAQLEGAAAIIQNRIEAGQAAVVAGIAGAGTPMKNGQICAVQTIGQSRTLITTFSEIVATQVLEAIRTRSAGNGPAYVGTQTATDCNGIYADPLVCPVSSSNALANPSTALTGANLRFSTFDGQNAFEFPGTTTTTATASTNEQKLYFAAMDYCLLAAGPRPQPPKTSSLTNLVLRSSPTDLTKLQLFRRAMAIESAFAYQCAHRVAKLTRPPTTGNDNSGIFQIIRQAGKDACAAYTIAANSVPAANPPIDIYAGLPGSLGAACRPGGSNNLSLYEIETLDILGCQLLTSAEAANVGGGSTGDATLMANRYRCTQIRNQWEMNENKELSNFAHALKDLQAIQSAYAGTDASASLRSNP